MSDNPFEGRPGNVMKHMGMAAWPETLTVTIGFTVYAGDGRPATCSQCRKFATIWYRLPDKMPICPACQVQEALKVIAQKEVTIVTLDDQRKAAVKEGDSLREQLKVANDGWAAAQTEPNRLKERVKTLDTQLSASHTALNDERQKRQSRENALLKIVEIVGLDHIDPANHLHIGILVERIGKIVAELGEWHKHKKLTDDATNQRALEYAKMVDEAQKELSNLRGQLKDVQARNDEYLKQRNELIQRLAERQDEAFPEMRAARDQALSQLQQVAKAIGLGNGVGISFPGLIDSLNKLMRDSGQLSAEREVVTKLDALAKYWEALAGKRAKSLLVAERETNNLMGQIGLIANALGLTGEDSTPTLVEYIKLVIAENKKLHAVSDILFPRPGKSDTVTITLEAPKGPAPQPMTVEQLVRHMGLDRPGAGKMWDDDRFKDRRVK